MPEANVVSFDVTGPNIDQLWMAAHDAVSGLLDSNRNRRWESHTLSLIQVMPDESISIGTVGLGTVRTVNTWRGFFHLTVHGLFEAP